MDAGSLEALARDEGFGTFLLATADPEALRAFAATVPVVRARVAARAAAGVRVETFRSAAVRARRRPGIDYDAIPASLADTAVEPGDARYGSVRSNYLRGGSPGLVLRPRTTAEVVDALGYARRHDVPLGVGSAGHGVSGRSINDGRIVIDLAALNGIEVLDPATRRVRVGPGARWGEVAQALHPHGGLYWSFETDRRPDRPLDAYPPATLRRLREVKRRYDPDNVFQDNVVIPAPEEDERVAS